MGLLDTLFKNRRNRESSSHYEPLVGPTFIRKEEPLVPFESDEIVSIVQDGIIDASDPLSLAKYRSNLRLLIEEAKKNGKLEKFAIIRNDDFFPENWQWCVNSRNTGMEYVGSNITYEIRCALAGKEVDMGPLGIPIPSKNSEYEQALKNIPRDIGLFYEPVRFRSTKHFTVNTPLGFTGSYNNVESERTFTVIDYIDSFLESGYAYSLSYRDAYLDITHENLPISPSAVVLISEDKYESVMSDEHIKEQLSERRVVVYRGDLSMAINMVLTELGILPSRQGNCRLEYDEEILNIIDQSIIDLCSMHQITYNQGHGNIDGRGGHFSDLYDDINREKFIVAEEIVSFLQSKFPNQNITGLILKDQSEIEKLISSVGVQAVIDAINEYNAKAKVEFEQRKAKFMQDRATITPEISYIFKKTVRAIDDLYKTDWMDKISLDEKYKIQELIALFYHSDKVENQLLAATTLCQKLNISIDMENTKDNNFSI